MTKETIKEIAGELDIGMRCFVHKTTGALVSIPDTLNLYYIDTESWSDAIDEIDNNIGDYVEIEKMNAHESFKIMEEFIETIPDTRLQNKLVRALNRSKPFRNFKYEIDNSGPYRQQWFDFKSDRLNG